MSVATFQRYILRCHTSHVDHDCCSIDQAVRSRLDYIATMIRLHQIAARVRGKALTAGIQPKNHGLRNSSMIIGSRFDGRDQTSAGSRHEM